MQKNERLAIRIPASEKQHFLERAEALGKTPSQLLLILITNYLNSDDVISAPEYEQRLLKLETEVNILKKLETEVIILKQCLEALSALKSENAALKQWRDSILQVALLNPPSTL